MSNHRHDHWQEGARVGARGVIVVDGKVLLLRYERGDELLYLYPGGGHHPGETLGQTAEREVLEETGIEVTASRLLLVHEHAPFDRADGYDDLLGIYIGEVHRVDFYFECIPASDAAPRLTGRQEPLHTGFSWAPLNDIDESSVEPKIVCKLRRALEVDFDPIITESPGPGQ